MGENLSKLNARHESVFSSDVRKYPGSVRDSDTGTYPAQNFEMPGHYPAEQKISRRIASVTSKYRSIFDSSNLAETEKNII